MAEAGIVASDIPSEVAVTDDQQQQKAAADKLREDASGSLPPETTQSAASSHLPEIELVDSPASSDEPPALDKDTLEKTATELHEAIFRRQLGIRDDADEEKIRRLLDPLNAADRAALEKTYHDLFEKNGSDGTLRRDLKQKLSETDWRESEAMLNRVDGRTNDAGALMLAVTRMKSDRDKGNAEILAVFRTLNSEQIAQLDRDFRSHYGMGYQDILREAKNINASTEQAIPLLEKGADRRTADDSIKLAGIALDARDRELYAVALSGDTPAAKQARQKLKQDDKFKERLAQTFPSDQCAQNGTCWKPGGTDISFEDAVDQVALDYLNEGNISLRTIADRNSGSWITGNKDNIELAARNATKAERDQFIRGRELALDNRVPASEEEKKALEYYSNLHSVFDRAGSERERAIWEDQLVHGRATIISDMARIHSDGHGPFKWGVGHDKDDLYKIVEGLSKEDWTLLRKSPEGRDFRRDIDASLRLYASDEERQFIMKMLDDKAAKTSYDDAKLVRRTLQQGIADNKGNAFLCFGTSYDARDITASIAQMSPEDAKNYKNNPEYRRQIDEFVEGKLHDDERILAQRLLKKVEATGETPKPDPIDVLLQDRLNGAKAADYLPHMEAIFADEKLRAQLSQSDDKLTAEEVRIKVIIQDMMYSAGAIPSETGDGSALVDPYLKELYGTGHLSLGSKSILGYKRSALIEAAVKSSPEEREKYAALFKPEEMAIVEEILKNKEGKADLTDALRKFIVTGDGDYNDFEEGLTKLSNTDKQKLKDEYFDKYGGMLNEDFLKKVKSSDRGKFENLLTPAELDGRQDFYDNYHKMLESRSGLSPDGSVLTVEKAVQVHANVLEEYQRQFQKLPPDQQEAMNEFFGEALRQYQDSKERLAEVFIDATITAAALAAAPFTAGMSTAALAAMVGAAAVAGAAYRVAAMKMVEGNDFDASPENIIKQLVIGGTNAALNFVGPELFAGAGRLTLGVADRAAAGVLKNTARTTLKEGAEDILLKEFKEATVKAGARGLTEKEAADIVGKIAREGTSEANLRVMQSTVQSIYKKTYQEAESELIDQMKSPSFLERARELGVQAVQEGAVGGASNAASEMVVSPMSGASIDWDSLKLGALVGVGVGAVMPVGIHVGMAGVSGGKKLVVNVVKRADGIEIDPAHLTEPITVRNVKTGETRQLQPGPGAPLKLTNDWQPVPEVTTPAAAADAPPVLPSLPADVPPVPSVPAPADTPVPPTSPPVSARPEAPVLPPSLPPVPYVSPSLPDIPVPANNNALIFPESVPGVYKYDPPALPSSPFSVPARADAPATPASPGRPPAPLLPSSLPPVPYRHDAMVLPDRPGLPELPSLLPPVPRTDVPELPPNFFTPQPDAPLSPGFDAPPVYMRAAEVAPGTAALDPDSRLSALGRTDDLDKKVSNLKNDLGIRWFDTNSRQRQKLIANINDNHAIDVMEFPDGPHIFNGNTRYYYAVKLGIPDTDIRVHEQSSGFRGTMAEYRQRLADKRNAVIPPEKLALPVRVDSDADGNNTMLDANNRIVCTRGANGHSAEFGYAASGELAMVKFGKGQTLEKRADGKWYPQDRSNGPYPVAKSVELLPGGTVRITTEPGFTLPDRPHDSINKIEYSIDGTRQVDYSFIQPGGMEPPEPQTLFDPARVREQVGVTPNGEPIHRTTQGEIVRRADGTHFETDVTGATRTWDLDGRIIEARQANGTAVKYTYDSDGRLASVDMAHDGELLVSIRSERKNLAGREIVEWYRIGPDGRKDFLQVPDQSNKLKPVRDVVVDHNGAIILRNADYSGTRWEIDGTEVRFDKNLRDKIDGSPDNIATQRKHLDHLQQMLYADPRKQERFGSMMERFEKRMRSKLNPGEADFEIANTYYSLRKMLEADNAVLPQVQRALLAEQLLRMLEEPHLISQGNLNTCNVNAEVLKRFFDKNPSAAVRLVTEPAVTGRFFTSEGVIVDMTQVRGGLEPRGQAAGTFEKSFKPNYGDIKRDGEFNFAEWIATATAIHVNHQSTTTLADWDGKQLRTIPVARATTIDELRSGVPYRPGDLKFEYNELDIGFLSRFFDKDEAVLVNNGQRQKSSARFREVVDPITGAKAQVFDGASIDGPNLSVFDLVNTSRQILGADEPPHLFFRALEDGGVTFWPGSVNTVDELRNGLLDLQQRGKMPATIAVDTRHPPFASKSASAVGGGAGGAHVINVHRVFQDGRGEWQVEFSNQWGRKANYMADNADFYPDQLSYPLNDLFAAMENLPFTPKDYSALELIARIKDQPMDEKKNEVWRWIASRSKRVYKRSP